jgi:hypothetical protein
VSAAVWIRGRNAGDAWRRQVMADPPGGGGSRACVEVEAAVGQGLTRREQGRWRREGGC